MSDQNKQRQGIYGQYWDYYVENHNDYHNRERKHEWPGDEWGSPDGWVGLYQNLFIPAGVQQWQRAVEIGPGSGKYTLKVLAGGEAVVRAYDVSERFLHICHQRCHGQIEQGRLSLQLLDTERSDYMLSDLSAFGWGRKVDAFYSIDAMVHVDLQYLIVYLITAGLMLKPQGKLILTLADATSELGFEKLVRDITWTFKDQGRPSGKFEWLSPELVLSLMHHLGFEVGYLKNRPRDLHLIATLVDPAAAEKLRKYIVPPVPGEDDASL